MSDCFQYQKGYEVKKEISKKGGWGSGCLFV